MTAVLSSLLTSSPRLPFAPTPSSPSVTYKRKTYNSQPQKDYIVSLDSRLKERAAAREAAAQAALTAPEGSIAATAAGAKSKAKRGPQTRDKKTRAGSKRR